MNSYRQITIVTVGLLLITLLNQHQSNADPPANKPAVNNPTSATNKPAANNPTSATNEPTANKPEPKHRKWKTGTFGPASPESSEHPLKLHGPLVITFLRSSIDPASPKKQYIMITGGGVQSEWFSPEEFTGELYLGADQQLITRKTDFSPRNVIYSGYEP